MQLLWLLPILTIGQFICIDGAANSSSGCEYKQDLAFVIDSSSSICNGGNSSYVPPGPCDFWFKCIEFVHSLVETMKIGPDDIQVACIIFSTRSTVSWTLDKHEDKESLLEAIDNLPYLKGMTDTASAYDDMIDKVFIASAGDRPNVPNTAIIITDGMPTKDEERVPEVAKLAHSKGIRCLAVGVGDEVDLEILQTLSSDPEIENISYFRLESYFHLDSVFEGLHNYTCVPEYVKIAEKMVPPTTTAPLESCTPEPCYNGGKCRRICDCVGGWRGDNCDIPPPDPCCKNPCQNGGVCKRGNTWDSFECSCVGKWTGPWCSKKRAP